MNLRPRSSRTTGPKMRVPDRLLRLVDQHGRIAVEADRTAIVAPHGKRCADDHRLVHVALLHLAARIASLMDTTITSPTEAVFRLERPAP